MQTAQQNRTDQDIIKNYCFQYREKMPYDNLDEIARLRLCNCCDHLSIAVYLQTSDECWSSMRIRFTWSIRPSIVLQYNKIIDKSIAIHKDNREGYLTGYNLINRCHVNDYLPVQNTGH